MTNENDFEEPQLFEDIVEPIINSSCMPQAAEYALARAEALEPEARRHVAEMLANSLCAPEFLSNNYDKDKPLMEAMVSELVSARKSGRAADFSTLGNLMIADTVWVVETYVIMSRAVAFISENLGDEVGPFIKAYVAAAGEASDEAYALPESHIGFYLTAVGETMGGRTRAPVAPKANPFRAKTPKP